MHKAVVLCLISISLLACETDLKIADPSFKPKPIIYCFINPLDSVQYIRVGRSFSAFGDPELARMQSDSIYFEQFDISLTLYTHDGDSVLISPARRDDLEKEPGYFGTENHQIYSFTKQLSYRGFSLYKSVAIEVKVAGLPVAKGSSNFIPRAVVMWPYVAQQYLFVDPDRPILVQWRGAAWNEVDIQFDILEQYRDSTFVKSLKFQESTNILMKEGVCQITFPYELIVQQLDRILSVDKRLVRRYFGPIKIMVHSGNQDFAHYMKTLDGINAYNGNPVSNIENALGFVACKWTNELDTLYFDYFSRMRFMEDPILKPYKFIEY